MGERVEGKIEGGRGKDVKEGEGRVEKVTEIE